MGRLTGSFRIRMILLLGLSMLLAGGVTYGIYKAMQLYYVRNARYGDSLADFRRLVGNFGDLNFFLIFFVPLAILFFFWLTQPYARYFREISTGIRRLASGDFESRVSIGSNDEFGSIAADMNLAGEKLKKAVERGDFAESSKDQLILNLAHDLRTPLTSVLGYLDFILQNEELSADQIKHYATIAFTKSRRLERLIDELFEITRMNYGMLTLDTRSLDLSRLLEQMNEELYPVFEKNRLTARTEIAPDVEIQGDGELLARVFENLLTNAARYGRDGRYVDIACAAENGEAVVTVTNYGDSIPQSELPHLFEMFYTGDRARVQREGSTGLGLFIAKNIVERHRGTISAQSDVIRTVFEVRLPL
ncbi:HAMP domain-containing sensor histidine kinase [Saccharibacillus sp. CPCC 101409]|uniref:sensor histidine kinase n=1 Tax=Saccharibacillus sp. CPCC 101409 TaxID=3058041 RepID=UPI002671F220|nr:HAMP domain-containing sensor histidine kinase [Saccharibacillus sp. CPCC 101409]MDO3409794.1 HAMP domain-containing sensor histidine kinase [Saccharibacillus sp. CPCC 101409]